MPGMGHAPSLTNVTVVSAFQITLIHQLWVILAVVALVALGWNGVRAVQLARHVRRDRELRTDPAGVVVSETGSTGNIGVGGGGGRDHGYDRGGAGRSDSLLEGSVAAGEPAARRTLRIGFGLLWLADGLLQLQSAMPLGLPTNVLRAAASGSPQWVKALVGDGADIWQRHPVQAAASAVWIQVGIGLLLLVARSGRWSRLGGAVSVGWALVVWIFGEAFGGIFAPGLSLLFGAPGAALFYGIAGCLVALPERAWRGRRLGRLATAGLGALFLAMAVLQAWPGRGSWAGREGIRRGVISSMVSQMAATRQPHAVASALAAFAAFDASHGWAVNFTIVALLAVSGALVVSGRTRLVSAGAVIALVLCAADWLLIEDLGVFGGTGTDPNSMVPIALLLVAGVLAYNRPAVFERSEAAVAGSARAGRRWERWTPRVLLQGALATCAVAVVAVGAIPMAAASMNRNADPIVAEATDGTPNLVDLPAPAFTLVDQRGQDVSLADLGGRVVALTFLDPVCTSDCPLIAQEFRQADDMLGPARSKAVFVAIVANPLYHSVAAMDAFDRQEGLSRIPNWLYLTGSVAQLRHLWNAYGLQVATEPAGSMIAHSDLAYVIDGRGNERVALDSAPAPGTIGASSFAVLLSGEIRRLLAG